MSEDQNNQDLFNIEENDPWGEDDLDLPQLNLRSDDETIDIDAIVIEDTIVEDTIIEEPAPLPAAEKEKVGFGTRIKNFFASLKKEDKAEKAPKVKKETIHAAAPVEKKQKEPRQPREREVRSLGALGPIFWTVSGAIALLIALILLVIVIILGFNAVKIANAINQDLVGELYTSFVQMDQAHIKTTIPIEAEVPAQFELLLDTVTKVTLSEDVFIDNANVSLSTGGLSITNAPTDIILPVGTELPIHLILTVPVDEMIPVVMDVEVDIPMKDTELHEPFLNLQQTIQPYYMWLWSLTTKGVRPLALPWNQ